MEELPKTDNGLKTNDIRHIKVEETWRHTRSSQDVPFKEDSWFTLFDLKSRKML